MMDGHELVSIQFSWGGYLECSCGYFRPEDEADWDSHLEAARQELANVVPTEGEK